MTGMLAPAKTPPAIIKRLHHEIVRVVTKDDVRAQFFSRGSEVVGSTPAEYLNAIKADIARKSEIIKSAGIKLD
jgi:tripartite-type tricarboxylate transporter receptor subunit TctC